ncbi:helix-turn-helix transcriptional regulator [Hydrogenovibrio halophilus]|uniref:helix-turn-helix transcriptional regulator n=1 Tax=Hydrogenovibrio halophilus TaxID=373391 RepID=UPI00037A0481|nr:WYL domain-containing protein [Hydrogenovibrio halophilus]
MNDTCYRKIQTLRALPKAPARKSVSDVFKDLKHQGFEIDRRSLQRDLKALARLFPIENDGNKDIPGWCWQKDAEKFELPEMSPSVALSFRMVKLFLERFMPPSTMTELGSYFDYADRILNSLPNNQLSDWTQKVRYVSRTQPLHSPEIDPQILSSVYEALLSDRQIKAHYKPRGGDPRDYVINPLGLVVVDQVMYLVCTLWEYEDVKQFALHRFRGVELSENPVNELDGFDLDDYVRQGHFEYVVEQEEWITLQLKISAGLYPHLVESRLSTDQVIEQREGDYFLKASVQNTNQLRWWLMGLGAEVEVLQPNALRSELIKNSQKLSSIYQSFK